MTSTQRLTDADAVARLARRDATLFSSQPEGAAAAAPWMGWVGLAQDAAPLAEHVRALAAQLVAAGITDAVLLGMGGSSLASIVLDRVLGPAPGGVRLHVLDTTCPDTVLAVADEVQPSRTVVLVSSKSGGTIEPMSLYAIFRERFEAALGREAAGKRFIALTDAGSQLEALATEQGFWTTLTTPADVGGRYSALTAFHLLPAALMGLDVDDLLRRARTMDLACRGDGPDNPAVRLAAFVGDGVETGRDKLTLVSGESIAALGLWVEQLVAESLGKLGRGVVPVLSDGPRGLIGADADRLVVVTRLADDTDFMEEVRAESGDAPVLEIVLDDPADVFGEFVRWEYATALAGFLTGVNPFDQPNVAEAKAATSAILGRPDASPAPKPRSGDLEVFASGLPPHTPNAPEALVLALMEAIPPGGYLALLAFGPEDEEFIAPLRTAVDALGWASGKAATLELGPRYLHSTGQLHKGGPATGVFLVLLAASGKDVSIPGAGYSLRDLMRAQALGDFGALSGHDRPVVMVEFTGAGTYSVDAFAAEVARGAQDEIARRRQSRASSSTRSTAPPPTSTMPTE